MTISSALKQDQQDLKELGLQLQTLFAQANVKNMVDYDAVYKDSLEQAKIRTQVEALKKSLNDDLTQLTKTNPAELEQQLHEFNHQIAAANNEDSD